MNEGDTTLALLLDIAKKALALLMADGHDLSCDARFLRCSCGRIEKAVAARGELWAALRRVKPTQD
jgi:hypothetical protein